MKRTCLLGVLLTVLMALTACGQLPSDSAVQPGLAVGAAPGDPLRYAYDGPSAGATAEQIVGGFLRAGAGFEDDHDVARSFLTSKVAAEWKPQSSVVVHAGESTLVMRPHGDAAVDVTVRSVATVDGEGYYVPRRAGSTTTGRFTLERVQGEWRISELPERFGVWLSEPEFQRIYGAFSINYVDPTDHAMVPDVRWFPSGPGLATSLARAQLLPVPTYLRGAVDTGVPSSTGLSVDAVSIEDGLAVVDLSPRALQADADHRRMMWAQFLTTLNQSPAVQRLTLRVAGTTLDLPGIPDEPSTPGQVGYPLATPDQQPALLRSGTALRRVDADRTDVTLPADPDAPVLPRVPLGWTGLAAPVSGPQLAAVGGDHRELGRWTGTAFYQVPVFGTDLTHPSFDSDNGLWVAGRSGGRARLWTFDTTVPMPQARPRAVEVPWIGDRVIAGFRMSALDDRAVLVARDARTGRDQVLIAAVVRDAKGRAVRLTDPLPVGSTLTSVQDVVWLSDRSVAALARTGTRDRVRPFVIDIGGDLTSLNPVDGAHSLTATGRSGEQGLLVLTDRGRLVSRAGASWIPSVGNVTGIVVPGA